MNRLPGIVLASAVVALSTTGVWAADTVQVGAVTPLSGKLQVYGEGFQKAMNLALEEVNAAGGIDGRPMEIVFEDNASTAQSSVSGMRKLITVHELPVIFGPAASSNFLAVCPVAQSSKIVLIGAESAAADISDCGSFVFRVFPSDRLQGEGAARLASELGYDKVALTYVNNDWGVGLAEAFKENYTAAGGRIVDEFAHDEGKTDYRAEVLRLQQAEVPAVVNLTYIKEGGTMLKQAYESRFDTQWLMGSASKSPKLVELAGQAAEGVIGTYPTVSQDTPEYQAYKQAWQDKYPDEKLPIFGEYNYDMVKLTAAALRSADAYEADAIRQALHEASQGYVGVTGDKTFDDNGDVSAVYGRWTVKNGEIVDYQE